MPKLIAIETIENKIYVIRGCKVMLDSDLARLYEVETKVLNQAVNRNADKFPSDFMFRLTEQEWSFLRSQIVTSNESRGGRRYLPKVFTEHGILMLSNILNSKKAVTVSIQIVRAFVKLREIALEPVQEVSELKKLLLLYMEVNDGKIAEIIEVLNNMLKNPQESKTIGFNIND